MKYLLLVMLLFTCNLAAAHGSSHPTHCTYEQSGLDLISHCKKDSRTWDDVKKDYYTPANIEQRRVDAIAQAEKERKQRPYLIAGFLVFVAAFVFLALAMAGELSKPI